jgi:hypothetical protein
MIFCREPASSASGRAASGQSSDEKNQVLCLCYFKFPLISIKLVYFPFAMNPL